MANRNMQVKIRKIKASRRKAYLKRPKSSGAAVGWLDWVHGKAEQLSKFEQWFFGIDHIPDDATRETANARRAELAADGERDSWHRKIAATSSVRSSKEIVEDNRRRLEAAIGVKLYNAVKLNDDGLTRTCLAWVSNSEYYIVRKTGLFIMRSMKFSDRVEALRHYNLDPEMCKRVPFTKVIKLDDIAPPAKPYLTGGGNVPYKPPF